MGVVTVHVDLVEHGEADPVVLLAESTDLVRRAGLLLAELVAGKAENLQALFLQVVIKRFQSLVLRRETALAGGVNNQQHLAFKISQSFFVATQGRGAVIINPHDVSQRNRTPAGARLLP